MTTGRIQQVVAHYRQQLNQHDAQAQQTLSDAYKRTLSSIQPALDRLYQQIDDKQQAGQAVPLSWLYEEKRLENIKRLITQQVNLYGGHAQAQTTTLQHIGVALGMQSAQAQLQASVPKGVNWQFGMPDTNAINDLVSASQPGSPLYDLFSTFGSQAADDVAGRLITGITLGQGPRMVARSVADALDIPRARALTIARTEMLRAYRSAALENYKANDDVVGGWIWSAALNARTCAACIAMNGTKHTLDETLDSHPNCRCAMVPETKSWSDILGPLGIDTSNIPDTTVNIQSGSDWLDNQDEATQQAILGNKYDGWSNGDFSLEDIVGTSQSDQWGNSIYVKSLSQMSKADSDAFPSSLDAQSTYLANKQASVLDSLTDEQKASITEYSYLNYRDINPALRDPSSVDKSDEAWIATEVASMDKAIAKGVIPTDLTTYRGVEAYGGTLDFYRQNIGSVVSDSAFQSTSLNANAASRFADEDGAVIYISVPKGATGLYINPLSQHQGQGVTQAEYELLLPRGTKYKIVKYVPATTTEKAIFYFEVQP